MKFSIIVPVYNRPDEIKELLESLSTQTFKDFELIVVEDGSTVKSEDVCILYKSKINLSYFYKENEGPSIGRNYGAQYAKGEYLIFTDSDCILPKNYLEAYNNKITNNYQGYGGPDEASSDFNTQQKAISYSMTSFLTTGGIRGRKKNEQNYVLRSFNMAILKSAFLSMGGFPITRLHPGEDTIFGIDFLKAGYKTKVIPEAFVFHKRRNTLKSFYKQVFNFGKVRYYIAKLYPNTFKITFLFPTFFVLYTIFALVILPFSIFPFALLALYLILIFFHATLKNKSVWVGFQSLATTLIQFFAYNYGFLSAFWKVEVKKIDEFNLNIINR